MCGRGSLTWLSLTQYLIKVNEQLKAYRFEKLVDGRDFEVNGMICLVTAFLDIQECCNKRMKSFYLVYIRMTNRVKSSKINQNVAVSINYIFLHTFLNFVPSLITISWVSAPKLGSQGHLQSLSLYTILLSVHTCQMLIAGCTRSQSRCFGRTWLFHGLSSLGGAGVTVKTKYCL